MQCFSQEKRSQECDAESPSVSNMREGFKEDQQGVRRGAGRDGLCLQVGPLGNGLAGHTEPAPAILGSHGEF